MSQRTSYHHGDLKNALIRQGIEALRHQAAETVSLREIAADLGVTKSAPYRHFRDRDHFLGALINEGFRLMHQHLCRVSAGASLADPAGRRQAITAMGRGYMDFAMENQELYRLMNAPLACKLDEEHTEWPRKTLGLLASTLNGGGDTFSADATAEAWAYIHGLVLLRIDRLFPDHLPQPDWDALAERVPVRGI